MTIRDQSIAAWRSGEPVLAGRLFFEALEVKQRPAWAARILAVALSRVDAPAAAHFVLELAADEDRWGEAHAAFDAVRDLTLKQERAGAQRDELLYGVLFVAENCAKVIFNASGRPAPFDHDSGWWLPSNARAVLKHRPELATAFEAAIFGP